MNIIIPRKYAKKYANIDEELEILVCPIQSDLMSAHEILGFGNEKFDTCAMTLNDIIELDELKNKLFQAYMEYKGDEMKDGKEIDNMLRDELKEMTMKAMDQKEYNGIVERMKHAAKSGRDSIRITNVSQCVIRKLESEGILVSGVALLDKGTLYILSWM